MILGLFATAKMPGFPMQYKKLLGTLPLIRCDFHFLIVNEIFHPSKL
jgi:hypothetical protein